MLPLAYICAPKIILHKICNFMILDHVWSNLISHSTCRLIHQPAWIIKHYWAILTLSVPDWMNNRTGHPWIEFDPKSFIFSNFVHILFVLIKETVRTKMIILSSLLTLYVFSNLYDFTCVQTTFHLLNSL